MTTLEEIASAEAAKYIRGHKEDLYTHFADKTIYLPDEKAISVFMAGSPGSGKTEFSLNLLKLIGPAVRIDADLIRSWIPGNEKYEASVYQKACTEGVNNLYGHVLKYKMNLILDGTFAYVSTLANIERSLEVKRGVVICYLYQDPLISWEFTKARQIVEKRSVPREVFINSFLKSQENVKLAKEKFGEDLTLFVAIKNYTNGLDSLELNVEGIDRYLPNRYTKEELETIIQ